VSKYNENHVRAACDPRRFVKRLLYFRCLDANPSPERSTKRGEANNENGTPERSNNNAICTGCKDVQNRQGLSETGYVEGQNLAIEDRPERR
jgi:hypothetical protein